MIICVTGGRDYSDDLHLYGALATLHALNYHGPITLIVHGGATGADDLAEQWARRHQIDSRIFRAQWDKLGPAAGPKRNKAMADWLGSQDSLGIEVAVVATPGGRGTADMIACARAEGLRVVSCCTEHVLPVAREGR